MLPTVLEILILLAVLFLLPRTPGNLIWIVIAIAIIIPGTYANWKGAPFVPTTKRVMKTMFKLANIKKGEKVYDLGCGDGRIVFQAAKLKAKAVGYEFSIPTFLIAKFLSLFHKNATIQMRDFWSQDYKDADVIFCYLLTESMQTFKLVVWPQLKPGTRVISHAFKMKGIAPKKKEGTVVLYVKGK